MAPADPQLQSAPAPSNAVRLVLYGGLAASTSGNPRPYSMSPFVNRLGNAEIAAVVNYLRERRGNRRSELSASDIEALQGIELD